MKINKKIISVPVFFMVFALLMIFAANESAYSEDIEEDATMVLPYDSIITGKMDEFSKRSIIVDYVRYSLCKKVRVFGTRNKLIALRDLDAAQEVKLFRNRRCIRKIKVLRFAQ